MSKEILITLQAQNKASPKIKTVAKDVTNLGKKVKVSSMSQAKSFEDVSQTLDALGNRFRYLSLVAGMAAGAMTMMASRFVKDAMALEQSQMKVGAFARISGQSFEAANEVAQKFARQGIMSVTEAYNTLSNLLATGLNIDKAEALMMGAQDMAVLAKESLTDTTGQAMEKFSLGIRIMQERMVDAVGINFVAIQVWKKYGDTINKTTDEMSSADKQQAMINYVMKEFVKVEGASTIAATTFSGTINRLSANVEQMSAALGKSLMPILGPLAELLIKAANSVREFAKEFPVLSMVALSGSVAVTVLVASIAMLGALVPMVTGKMSIGITALKSMAAVSMITTLKFIALAIAIGTLIYLIAKATGQWDKFTNAMKNMQKRIADTIKPAKTLNEEMTDPKVTKQLKKVADQMALTTRNFEEGMAKWVRKHDETTKKLKTQIQDLTYEYEKAVNKINSSFEESQEDRELSYTRRVEDLQRAIDEEVSKGLWADQTKIRNLKRELARENEDKDIADKKDKDRKEEDLKDTKKKYDGRLAALEKELKAAEKLEKDHAKEIEKWRNKPLLDYIDEQKRQYTERMTQLQEQMGEIKSNADEQLGLNGDIGSSFDDVGDAIDGVTDKSNSLGQSFKEKIKSMLDDNLKFIESLGYAATAVMGIITAIALVKAAFKTLMAVRIGLWFLGLEATAVGALGGIGIAVGTLKTALLSIPMGIVLTVAFGSITLAIKAARELKDAMDGLGDAVDSLIQTDNKYIDHLKKMRDEGKISQEEYRKRLKELQERQQQQASQVSQLPAQLETPTIVSGAIQSIWDMITPRWPFKEGGIVPGSTHQAVPILAHGGETIIPANQSPVTVNINGPVVRNDNDITQLANQVENVLSRRTFLRRFT